MPINNIDQPVYIVINDKLRLHYVSNDYAFALEWYQDLDTVKLVDGTNKAYDLQRLNQMYKYLDKHGELYFIEYLVNDKFIPIGDVTFSKDDLPIVIGVKEYRNRGIAKLVIKCLIERAKSLGYKTLGVSDIYNYNEGSKHLFTSLGFKKVEVTKLGYSYKLEIT